jgi:uncharacterized protein (TIGR02145 family)
MRTKILVLSLALILSANLRAQVVIGELAEPAPGTILDLNKAVKGGLILSNVELERLYEIPAGFPGMTATPDLTVMENFTGAMVYHTGVNSIPAGIYVWNGTNWAPVEENCTPLANESQLTLTPPFFNIKTGATETFSVSRNDANARCAVGETYTWSVTPGTAGTDYAILNQSTAPPIKFNTAGDYTVTVNVKSPYSSTAVSKSVDVTVNANGSGIHASKLNPDYGITGATCLDVKKPNTGQDPAVYAARNDDFAQPGDYTKTYKFLHKAAYSALVLSYYDDSSKKIIKSITQPPSDASTGGASVDGYYEEEFTVEFKSDIKDLAPDNGDSLTVKLVASYKPDGSSDTKWAYLEIRVEDGTCVCPAQKSAMEWLHFMCHNLGAEYDIISPSQLITRAHHGDWYMFGAKNASLTQGQYESGNVPDWNNASVYPRITGYDYSWNEYSSDLGNPCPAGWRMPAQGDWNAVRIAVTAKKVPATWHVYQTDQSEFRNLMKFGGDYLFLPAAGARNANNGSLSGRGSGGNYWSSFGYETYGVRLLFDGTNGDRGMHGSTRSTGFSVRCVSTD